MSLSLRPDIREPLVEKLSDILYPVGVSNNWFPDHTLFSELDDLEKRLQKKKEIRQQSEEYISDRPW